MQPENSRRTALVREWVSIARDDLDSARRLLEHHPIMRTSTYHSQQTIEKVLKGFLTWHQVTFPWTHNLEQLVVLCAEIDPEFRQLIPAAEFVTPYATAPRYPADLIEISFEDGKTALGFAEQSFLFVLDRLPSYVHPD